MGRTLELVNRLNPTSRLAGCNILNCPMSRKCIHVHITGEMPTTVLRRVNPCKTIVSTYPVLLSFASLQCHLFLQVTKVVPSEEGNKDRSLVVLYL